MRSRNVVRIEALYRLLMLNFISNRLDIILVNEFPKCGGTWVSQLLSESTGVPFPRQRFPSIKQSIFHGHYLKLSPPKKTLIFWRDPRDVIVSWYYHCLFESDKNNHDLVREVVKVSGISNPKDIKKNLGLFIDYSFGAPLSPRFTYNDFFDKWFYDDTVVHSRYEDLHRNPIGELIRIHKKLGLEPLSREDSSHAVNKFSFSNQKKIDETNNIDSKAAYLRKGIVGDWRNCFTKRTASILNTYLDGRLEKLGYEGDSLWLEELPD